MSRKGVLAAAIAVMAAACTGNSSTSPSSTTPVVTGLTSDLLTGRLSPGGTNIQSFAVAQDGIVHVTLAAITPASATAPLLAPALNVTINVAAGTLNADSTCTVVGALILAPALTSQLAVPLPKGNGCVQLSDIGNLTADVNVTVRVDHP